MTVNKIKNLLHTSDYSFLKDNPLLNENIILLTLGGSHAYGMNKEGSDIDIRGISLNPKNEILLGRDFEQVVDTNTDTTIYSFKKMIKLLTENNPNTLEILGCRPEHYLYLTNIGQELLDNKHIFLSKKCITTFSGYAGGQLRRLENKSARNVSQSEREKHILKTIENARYSIDPKYTSFKGNLDIYISPSNKENLSSEIVTDINLKGYPLRDFNGLIGELAAIIRSYEKNSSRNEKAESHDKLGKHMAHLLRLYMMCIDILEKEEVITYRENEHDLLMDIRNGKYLDENKQPLSSFYDILNDYEKRLEYAKKNTSLPDVPNYKEIEAFELSINEKIIKDNAYQIKEEENEYEYS